jgi:hypothetical protein
MCVKRVGVFALAALALGAVLWAAFGPGLPGSPNRAEAQQGGKATAGRYEFISAGLVTAIMIDRETGKTYALASAGLDRFGGVGMGGPEFAWVPITKFENVEAYRNWMQEQHQRLRKKMEEEFGKKDKFEEKKFEEKPKDIDKGKFEEKKDKFEERSKLEPKRKVQRVGADRVTARILMPALLLSESPPSYLSVYRLANVSALASWSQRPRR